MYKIYIDYDGAEYLDEWASKIKRYIVDCPPVSRKYLLIFKEIDLEIYVTVTKNGYKYSVKHIDRKVYDKQIVKGKIIRTPDGENDFQIQFEVLGDYIREVRSNNTKEDAEDMLNILPTVTSKMAASFLLVNGFLMYGNVLDDKGIVATGRNSGFDKVIVFRPYKNKLYAVPTSRHRSPEGVFSVRGHFRHYKSGKLVWIDEFLKGTEIEEE